MFQAIQVHVGKSPCGGKSVHPANHDSALVCFQKYWLCMQAFKLESPSWLKYLQIRQLSHHGMEAVCALNDVCVYGKSAAEDLEDRLSQENPAEESQEAVDFMEDGHGIAAPVLPLKAVEQPSSSEPKSEDAVLAGEGSASQVNATDKEPAPDKELEAPQASLS